MRYVLIAAVVLFGFTVWLFNRLVARRQRVRAAFAQIDVQLKRRHDLIPNLVEVARTYMAHERGVFERVAKARADAIAASGVSAMALSENALSGAMRGFFAVVEQYPALKADVNMRALQDELVSTENKIAFARQFYNEETMLLNIGIESFPGNIIAGLFGFIREDFFALDDTSQAAAPAVVFQPETK